mmetsp:Transcript_2114/g.3044  ORF Transcript_2114/g.3044 Transcript_2114/m.3044 type:complete len:263 (+) Transcript_2114:145-933(+)
MGQKFRVRCYANSLHPPGFEGISHAQSLASPDLVPVYSNPIESRSKRPSGRSRSPAPRKRARTTYTQESDGMDRIVNELSKTQEKLEQTQTALHKMVMVLQHCVTRLGAVEAATEQRSASSESKEAAIVKPPAMKRQRSMTRKVFRTDDNNSAFFKVYEDGITPVNDTKDVPAIPQLLRQFSQEFVNEKGEYPLLETGAGVLPPRISSTDLNTFLTDLPGVDRSLTPSFVPNMMRNTSILSHTGSTSSSMRANVDAKSEEKS